MRTFTHDLFAYVPRRASKMLEWSPQVCSRVEKLIVSKECAPFFSIGECKVDGESQMPLGWIPATVFGPDSLRNGVRWRSAMFPEFIEITVRNDSDEAREFAMKLLGSQLTT